MSRGRPGFLLAQEQNALLARIPAYDRAGFIRRCDVVELRAGQSIVVASKRTRYVYFPLQAYVSLMGATAEGAALEVALVGNEGMVGATSILGVESSPFLGAVVGGGRALRMSAVRFRREVAALATVREVVLRYLYFLGLQAGISAGCAHFHPVQRRLARWLLSANDRSADSSLLLTQAILGRLLGVRRVGITLAAQTLQGQRLIRCRRGAFEILDRVGLERVACSCYALGERQYLDLFG